MNFTKSCCQAATTGIFGGTSCSRRCTSIYVQLSSTGPTASTVSTGEIIRNNAIAIHIKAGDQREWIGLSEPTASADAARIMAKPIPLGRKYRGTNTGVMRWESKNNTTGAESR